MRYQAAPIYKLIKDEVAGLIYPEILPNAFDVGPYRYQTVQPLGGENIVALTKRVYGETDPWWIVMILNDIISPFEVLTQAVKAPEAKGLREIYTSIMRQARNV
jgi:hypothetical protein